MPMGNAVLVVTDRGADAVLLFDGHGRPLRELVASGAGPIDRPSNVRFDDRGSLYVANFGDGGVLRYDEPAGRFEEVVFHDTFYLEEPVALEFFGDRLFVLGNDSQNVVVLQAATGEFLREFGRSVVRRPHDFAFGIDRNLYIATGWDANKPGVVQVWDVTEDRMLRRFGLPDEIGDATALAFGHGDEIYVADYFTGRIALFSSLSGEYLGDVVAADSYLARPVAMAVGPGGDLYVAADGGVHRLSPDGAYRGLFVAAGDMAQLSRPRGLTWRFGEAAVRLEL